MSPSWSSSSSRVIKKKAMKIPGKGIWVANLTSNSFNYLGCLFNPQILGRLHEYTLYYYHYYYYYYYYYYPIQQPLPWPLSGVDLIGKELEIVILSGGDAAIALMYQVQGVSQCLETSSRLTTRQNTTTKALDDGMLQMRERKSKKTTPCVQPPPYTYYYSHLYH